jgi:hypothetical protein
MRNVIEKALANKYGSELTEFKVQRCYHSQAPEDCSFQMVWYVESNGAVGRQWLETIEQWAAGNTEFYFEHIFGG